MPERMDPAEAERIAAAIDWQPTCLDGQERQTIVRQIGDMVAERLSAQRDAALAVADAAEHGCTRWEHPLPVPEWVGRLREALGVTDGG